jgi:hypothetical protein
MFTNHTLGRHRLTFLLLAAMGAVFLPLDGLAEKAAPKGNLIGFVYLTDVKTPVADALVKIRGIKEGTEFKSEPTDQNGSYKLLGVDEGQYVLGVSAKNGDYNLEVLIQIKGGETGKLSLILKEGQVGAVLAKNAPKAAFFAKPLGIALLAGASAVAVIAGVSLINRPPVSPSSPIKK